MNKMKTKALSGASALLLGLMTTACTGTSEGSGPRPDSVPAAGESRTVDRILEQGELRVGVLPEYPWLLVNDGDEPFSGPSWLLATKYAEALGVTLEPVPVSNDTKVPLIQSGGVDITIGPLNETPERKEVIEFVTYSRSAICFYGLRTNQKVAAILSEDDLKDADVTIAYFVGQPFAEWIPSNFPKAEVRAVQGSGSDAPIEELLSGRADYVPTDAIKMGKLQAAYPDLTTVPRDCLNSELQSVNTGHGIPKDDPVFAEFLRAIQAENAEEIRELEKEIIESGQPE